VSFVARSGVVSSALFFGTPVKEIAEICAVSLRTAYRWKTGQAYPPPTALKLFLLYRDRRVLGEAWEGWLINRDTLVDPEGNATTQPQLRAYALNYQLLRELTRNDPAARDLLEKYSRIAG
jgi:hypothetical protein